MNVQIELDRLADEAEDKGMVKTHNELFSLEIEKMLRNRGYDTYQKEIKGKPWVFIKG